MLVSRQGRARLTKFYEFSTKKQQEQLVREVSSAVLSRPSRDCNFLPYKGRKIVYKRYASLYFISVVDKNENELGMLETIHHFVEVLDRYFGNVCELDIIFNFHKAYFLLDELIIGGRVQETSKRELLRVCTTQDEMMDAESAGERSITLGGVTVVIGSNR